MASTSTMRSPSGSGTSASRMTSGPPLLVIWIARMAALFGMDDVSEFIQAATSGRRARAEALYRDAVTRDPWARLTHGDGWEGDAEAPGGPKHWAPLLYVTHSVFASAPLATELLERGADPD